MCITFITVYPFLLSLPSCTHHEVMSRPRGGALNTGILHWSMNPDPCHQHREPGEGKVPLVASTNHPATRESSGLQWIYRPQDQLICALVCWVTNFPDPVFWPVVMVNSGCVILLWAVVDCRILTFNTWWLVTGPLQCIINLASGCFTALDLTTFCSSSVTDSMKWHTWLYQVFVIEPSGPLLSWVYRLHTYFLLHLQFWLYLTWLILSSFCLCVYIQELRMDAKSMPITSQHSVTELYV